MKSLILIMSLFILVSCDKEENKQQAPESKVLQIEANSSNSVAYLNGSEIFPVQSFNTYEVFPGDTIQIVTVDSYWNGQSQYFNEVTAKIKVDDELVFDYTCNCEINHTYIIQ